MDLFVTASVMNRSETVASVFAYYGIALTGWPVSGIIYTAHFTGTGLYCGVSANRKRYNQSS